MKVELPESLKSYAESKFHVGIYNKTTSNFISKMRSDQNNIFNDFISNSFSLDGIKLRYFIINKKWFRIIILYVINLDPIIHSSLFCNTFQHSKVKIRYSTKVQK